MENLTKCPCCSHHCDRNNLQCGKGESYFNGESNADFGHGHHEKKRHGHRRPEFPAGSLADLMAKCAHRLFHGGDTSMFGALTAEETAALEKLLTKLLEN